MGVFGARNLGSERAIRGLEVAGRKKERLIIVARAGGLYGSVCVTVFASKS